MTIVDAVLLALLGTIAAAEIFGAVITYRRWRLVRSKVTTMRVDAGGDRLGDAMADILRKHIRQGR